LWVEPEHSELNEKPLDRSAGVPTTTGARPGDQPSGLALIGREPEDARRLNRIDG
jgi:hypothetical protein